MTRGGAHPGRVLELVFLEPEKTTVEQFADMAGIDVDLVQAIVRGEAEVTADLAVVFGAMTGTSARFWLSLQEAADPASVSHGE